MIFLLFRFGMYFLIFRFGMHLLYLSTNTQKFVLQVSGNALQQVVMFKYLRVVFMSDGMRNEEIYTWQRRPESLFQSPTLLLFQNLLIQVQQFFKFKNPTPVQTSSAIIDSTLIYPCFYLTLWELVYDIFVLRFQPKNSSFRLPYQRHSSSADCARELFKGSNGSASLVDCTRKKIFWLGMRIFLTDVISEVVVGSF